MGMTTELVERLEFRPDDKGEFDEIVARFGDGSVHVETMDKNACYVGFYWDDGRYCQWWISCTGRGKLTYNHEDGQGNPPKFPTGYAADKLEHLARSEMMLREALEAAAAAMTCRRDDDAHYCPNCDNSLHAARDAAREALSRGHPHE